VQIKDREVDGVAADSATQLTVQELLQEREITYRNLLAAYLKLQEVNRQKTVFLASAAHELKTPLAVIKGYYDLLLAGSLGRLTEKQKDILEESKESCERLVRLVSMFLNYSALESESWCCNCARMIYKIAWMRWRTLAEAFKEKASNWKCSWIRRFQHFDSTIKKYSRQRQTCWTTR
jgi:signal transduction histidine kinase